MASKLAFHTLVGHDRIKTVLSTAFDAGQLAHAYLFTGPAGVGKFAAALELAMGVLCDAETGPCGECESCRMVVANNHPDFRCIFPVTLDKKHKASSGDLNDEGWTFVRDLLKERLEHPYALVETPATANIPVDWVRDLNTSILRGAVRRDRNVAIICDVDIMSQSAANAMLKTLEEPPAGALIVLLSSRPHGVLMTVRSRCQSLRFGQVDDATITTFLTGASGRSATDVATAVDASEGSPGRALSELDDAADHAADAAVKFFSLCGKLPLLEKANGLQELATETEGEEPGHLERLFSAAARLVRKQVISHTNDQPIAALSSLSSNTPSAVARVFESLEDGAAKARARTNALLILTHVNLTISEILNDSH